MSSEKFNALIDEFHALAERLKTSFTLPQRRILLPEMSIVTDKLGCLARDKKPT